MFSRIKQGVHSSWVCFSMSYKSFSSCRERLECVKTWRTRIKYNFYPLSMQCHEISIFFCCVDCKASLLWRFIPSSILRVLPDLRVECYEVIQCVYSQQNQNPADDQVPCVLTGNLDFPWNYARAPSKIPFDLIIWFYDRYTWQTRKTIDITTWSIIQFYSKSNCQAGKLDGPRMRMINTSGSAGTRCS